MRDYPFASTASLYFAVCRHQPHPDELTRQAVGGEFFQLALLTIAVMACRHGPRGRPRRILRWFMSGQIELSR